MSYPLDLITFVGHVIIVPWSAVLFFKETRLILKSARRRFLPGNTAMMLDQKITQVQKLPESKERTIIPSKNTNSPILETAIIKSAAFLKECLRSGSYSLATVGSDGASRFSNDKGHLFVASYIVEAMNGLLDEIDRTIILTRILCEEQDGLWGYQSPGMLYSDETLPFLVDSDDTAFVIRTLHRLGVNRVPQRLMRFYRESEQLFVTWDTGTHHPVWLTAESALRNNFLAHPEVNANIFFALRGSHFEKYINYEMLLKSQDERGFWKSYFYPSPLYATLLVLDLTRGNPVFFSATKRALKYIVGSQNSDGSWGTPRDACETALAIAALSGHQAYTKTICQGIKYLLSTMSDDGSWTSCGCIWESYVTENDCWRGYDIHRAYVTSRCLIALRRAAGHM